MPVRTCLGLPCWRLLVIWDRPAADLGHYSYSALDQHRCSFCTAGVPWESIWSWGTTLDDGPDRCEAPTSRTACFYLGRPVAGVFGQSLHLACPSYVISPDLCQVCLLKRYQISNWFKLQAQAECGVQSTASFPSLQLARQCLVKTCIWDASKRCSVAAA